MYYFISSTNIFISHSHTTHHTPSDKNSILSPIPYIFLNICCHPCFTILLSDPEKETGYRRANTKWCRVYLSLFFATSLISTFSSSFSPFLSPVNSTVRTSSSSTALTVSSYHFHCRGNRYKLCDALPSESELFLCSFFSLLSLPCLFRFFWFVSSVWIQLMLCYGKLWNGNMYSIKSNKDVSSTQPYFYPPTADAVYPSWKKRIKTIISITFSWVGYSTQNNIHNNTNTDIDPYMDFAILFIISIALHHHHHH